MRLFCCAFILCVTTLSYAQAPFKYGKVNPEELKLQACDFDPDASAMVLGHTGSLTFFYSDDKGCGYKIDIVKRVKIF
ncbi:MAG: hypothetical protein AAGA85_03600, partial [Bacteroidota bacterium]